jgi:hypothetical protein
LLEHDLPTYIATLLQHGGGDRQTSREEYLEVVRW